LNVNHIGTRILGIGWIGLALLCLFNGDFLLQWQPVSKELPLRGPLAIASSIVLLACGLGLLWPSTRRLAGLILTLDVLVWTVGLQLPAFVQIWKHVGTWVPFGENCVLVGGAWTVVASPAPNDLLRRICRPIWLLGDGTGITWARRLFAACCLLFGVAHFLYAQFTAEMIPSWIPGRLALAYFTGVCHFAAGLAILFRVLTRLAARLEALMMSLFVVLLHIPSVFLNPLPFYAPTLQTVWASLFIATVLSGSAWVIAGAVGDRPNRQT